jgi:hypothetical protein
VLDGGAGGGPKPYWYFEGGDSSFFFNALGMSELEGSLDSNALLASWFVNEKTEPSAVTC